MGAVNVNIKIPDSGAWYAVERVNADGEVLPVCYLGEAEFEALRDEMERLAGPCNFDRIPRRSATPSSGNTGRDNDG